MKYPFPGGSNNVLFIARVGKDYVNKNKRAVLDKGGWTPFPNWIIQNFEKFHPAQYKILSLVIFATIGSASPNNRFSIRYISDRTNLNKTTVHKHLKIMLAAGWLIDAGRGGKGEYLLEIPSESPFLSPGNQDSNTTGAMKTQDTIEQIPGQQASWKPGQNKEVQYNNINKDFWQTISGILGQKTVQNLRSKALDESSLVFPENIDPGLLGVLQTMRQHGYQIRFAS